MSDDVRLWFRTDKGAYRFIAKLALIKTDQDENLAVLDTQGLGILKERIADVEEEDEDDEISD